MNKLVIPYTEDKEVKISKAILKIKSVDKTFRYRIDRRNKSNNKLVILKMHPALLISFTLKCLDSFIEKMKNESE